MFSAMTESIIGRAQKSGKIQINIVNIRDYSEDKHMKCDDYPFGGGAGMVMMAQPIGSAIEALDPEHKARRIYFDNGEVRLYDVAPILRGDSVFAPFRELEHFRRVYLDESHSVAWDIDPEVDSTVVWNNKVDLCPDSCYVDSVPVRGGTAGA